MNLRILCFSFLFLLNSLGFSQELSDFQNPNFQFYPHFYGDTSQFNKTTTGLESAGAGNPLILYQSLNYTDSFELQILLNIGFATSSNNYVKLILSEEIAPKPDSFDGFFVQLGNTADEISFYKQENQNSSLIIDGLDKRIASSNTRLHLKILRSNQVWEIYSKIGNESVWTKEGEYAAILGFNLKTLALYFRYSSSNANKLSLHSYSASNPIHDTLAPKLKEFFAWSKNQLLFRFDEALDTSGLLIKCNGASLTKVQFIDAQSFFLEIDSSININQLNQWELDGFKDLSGNKLSKIDTFLSFYFPKFGDIIFNEIMYDPSPALGLPEVEYLEIYNNSSHRLSLEAFLFEENTSHIFPSSSYLGPSEHALLIDQSNLSLFDSTINLIPLDLKSGFLNNTGECLLLKNRSAQVLDSLCYSDKWHSAKDQDGVSIELIEYDAPCFSLDQHWTSSISNIGGTPSTDNSVKGKLLDSSAPKLLAYEIISADSILLRFDEELFGYGKILLDSMPIDIKTILPNSQILLKLSHTLIEHPKTIHHLQMEDFKDCSGNSSPKENRQFRYAKTEVPLKHDLHFSEVLFRPAGNQQEFIEVHNASEKAIQLKSLKLRYQKDEHFLPNQIIYPDETYVLCKSCSPLFPDSVPVLELSSFPNLSSLEAQLSLLCDSSLVPIHQLFYHYDLIEDPKKQIEGFSLELKSDASCGKEVWEASKGYGGSPGSFAPRYYAFSQPKPELLAVYPVNKFELRFSFDGSMKSEWHKNSQFRLDSIILHCDSLVAYDPFLENWNLHFTNPIELSANSVLFIDSLTACSGELFKTNIPLARSGITSSLRFNEILFNPEAPLEDYIELSLSGDSALDLKPYSILSLDETGQIKSSMRLAEEGRLVYPDEYPVFSDNTKAIYQNFKQCDRRLLIEATLVSMNADKGVLLLVDSLGNLIDSLAYDEKMHHAGIQNAKGVALEKIRETKPSYAKSNWTSASSSSGFGTPCKRNSQARNTENLSSDWQLSSSRLSPDGDGYEDLLLLSYKNSEPTNRVNIKVLNRFGQEVYTLAQREILGAEGFYTWDGIDKNGRQSPWGAYVLWIEVYSEKGKETTRLNFALVGKIR